MTDNISDFPQTPEQQLKEQLMTEINELIAQKAMAENDAIKVLSQGGKETPPTQPNVFSNDLNKQLVMLLSLVNLLLFASITALVIKLGWLGLLAVIAVF
tara:strand:+ start:4017 stop:4316 length:300 start_codon:yes stop_codon:yes gene_type:complete